MDGAQQWQVRCYDLIAITTVIVEVCFFSLYIVRLCWTFLILCGSIFEWNGLSDRSWVVFECWRAECQPV